jgi:hypothetical protein
MKYFISNKESEHLNFTKLTEQEFLETVDTAIDELYIYPGTFETSEAPEALLAKIKMHCKKDSKITIGFINIYQVFVNVANHKIDLGIGHATCKSIKNAFNVQAAHNFILSAGLDVSKVYLEDGCSIIKVECNVKS